MSDEWMDEIIKGKELQEQAGKTKKASAAAEAKIFNATAGDLFSSVTKSIQSGVELFNEKVKGRIKIVVNRDPRTGALNLRKSEFPAGDCEMSLDRERRLVVCEKAVQETKKSQPHHWKSTLAISVIDGQCVLMEGGKALPTDTDFTKLFVADFLRKIL